MVGLFNSIEQIPKMFASMKEYNWIIRKTNDDIVLVKRGVEYSTYEVTKEVFEAALQTGNIRLLPSIKIDETINRYEYVGK